jgi:hypothetical protein
MTERKMEENKMPRTYKHWTKEEDRLLRDLRAERYSSKRIANYMGRTKSSISNRISILGLPVRKAAIKPNPVVRLGLRIALASARANRMGSLMALLTGRK